MKLIFEKQCYTYLLRYNSLSTMIDLLVGEFFAQNKDSAKIVKCMQKIFTNRI